MFFSSLMLTVRRLIELFISSLILSVICVLLNTTGLTKTNEILTICLAVAMILFHIINVFFMRRCFFELEDKKLYYISNIAAYIMFAAVTFIIGKFASQTVYTWLFAITKFAKFNSFGITTSLSALFFHIIGLICVIAAPIGMSWVLADDMEEDAEFLEEKSLL